MSGDRSVRGLITYSIIHGFFTEALEVLEPIIAIIITQIRQLARCS